MISGAALVTMRAASPLTSAIACSMAPAVTVALASAAAAVAGFEFC